MLHFGTLDVWYTGLYTTSVGTLSGFWYTMIVIGYFRYVWYTVFTCGTPVAFGTVRIGSVFI